MPMGRYLKVYLYNLITGRCLDIIFSGCKCAIEKIVKVIFSRVLIFAHPSTARNIRINFRAFLTCVKSCENQYARKLKRKVCGWQ